MEEEKKTVLSEIINASLDKLVDHQLENMGLELVPGGTIIRVILKSVRSIHNAHFLRKYGRFLDVIAKELNEVEWTEQSKSKIDNMLKKWEKKHGINKQKVVEMLIIQLDRVQTELKAKLIGKLFISTFKEHRFSFEEYSYLLFSIELIHPIVGITTLKKYYDIDHLIKLVGKADGQNEKYQKDKASFDYSSIATTGLLTLPKGGSYLGSYGGASINEIGIKFVKFVLIPIQENFK